MTEHDIACTHGPERHPASHASHLLPAVVLRPKKSAPTFTHQSWWRQIIAYLRRWSGDDAYERYLAEHQGHAHALLNRREFYRRYLDKRASGSRCC